MVLLVASVGTSPLAEVALSEDRRIKDIRVAQEPLLHPVDTRPLLVGHSEAVVPPPREGLQDSIQVVAENPPEREDGRDAASSE